MRTICILFTIAMSLNFTVSVWAQDVVPSVPAAPPSKSPAATATNGKPAPLYDEGADVETLIADALARAKKENRRVLIQWGGNWCGWCIRLHGLYTSDKDIARKLVYEYDVVYADAGRPEGKNMDLAARYGAELSKHGFPYLTILDADGKVLANQDTGSLEIKGATALPWHDPRLVMDFLTKHQAPYLEAQKVLDAGLAEAAQSGRRVFLHFGAPWCGWCRRLDAWMAQQDVKGLLSKDFVEVKIDIDRTIDGGEMLDKLRPMQGGIPWFVILDSTGQPIVDSNDIGYPVKEEEMEALRQLLDKSASNISKPEIEQLIDSLKRANSKLKQREN